MKNTNIKPRSKALRILAILASYVFHPVFMPTAVALAISFLNVSGFAGIPDIQKGKWIVYIAVNTLFFPLVATLLMKALGFIESIHLRTMKDRIIPLIATMIFYFWAYRVFKSIHAPFILNVFLLGCFWGVIVVFMINIFSKISMHTAAAGGMLGILFVLLFIGQVNFLVPIFLAMLIAGIIGTARLTLGAHTPFEIWLGYGAGIVTQIAAYFFLK
jgi:hypothetical protein